MSRIEVQFSSGAFMPGEPLLCKVDVSNDPAGAPIAWVAVQVHGVVGIDPTRTSEGALPWSRTDINPKTSPAKKAAPSHALPPLGTFGPHSYVFLTAPLTILAADVAPGSTRHLLYYLLLPTDLPPTYKGAALRFSYFLTVAAQKSLAAAKISRFPIRIVNPAAGVGRISVLSSASVPDSPDQSGAREMDAAALSSAAAIDVLHERWCSAARLVPPPWETGTGALRMRQQAHANVMRLAAKQYNDGQQPASYNISKGREHIVRFALDKTAYQLGEVIYGAFDFSNATTKCVQVSAWLETVEELPAGLRSNVRGAGTFRRAYAEHHEYTMNTLAAHFMFQIPVEAAHEFSSDVVSLSWVLRFEFISLDGVERQLDPLLWELPLRILVPTHPSDLLFSPHFTLL